MGTNELLCGVSCNALKEGTRLQVLSVLMHPTIWWAPKFEGSVPRPETKVRTNFERAKKLAGEVGAVWKPQP